MPPEDATPPAAPEPTPAPAPTPAPEPAPAAEHWSGAIQDESLKGIAAKFDSQDALLGAIGYKAPSDWRESLSDDAKKYAERFTDLDGLIAGALDMRKQLSAAIVPPGKDAKPEEVAAYRKRLGVPETPEGYKFTPIKGTEPTEADKAFQKALAEAYHGLNVSTDQAKALNKVWNEQVAAMREAQIEADQAFAEESDAALRKAWGAGYDRNMEFAKRAAARMFGDDMTDIEKLETKDGRFILDHPIMLRPLAVLGREMAEGGLIPPMSDDERGRVEEQVKDVRARAEAAKQRGDHKEANRLYQEEQRLIAQSEGAQPIVGAAGRAA